MLHRGSQVHVNSISNYGGPFSSFEFQSFISAKLMSQTSPCLKRVKRGIGILNAIDVRHCETKWEPVFRRQKADAAPPRRPRLFGGRRGREGACSSDSDIQMLGFLVARTALVTSESNNSGGNYSAYGSLYPAVFIHSTNRTRLHVLGGCEAFFLPA